MAIPPCLCVWEWDTQFLMVDSPTPQTCATGIVADLICKEHVTGPGHPERVERFDAVVEGLGKDGLLEPLVKIAPRVAGEEELLLCHTADYLRETRRAILDGSEALDADTRVCAESWDVASRAAGGVLNAVDAVVEGKVVNAFCVVRPPGHHACADRAMGFCIFNNVAIAARYAQRKHGLKRALIVDWDVHHGNGTQDIFYEDGSVFFFSTHQSPWYPGTGHAHETGAGAGVGTTLNCPLPAGSGRKEIFRAFRDKLVPAADAFRPDIVFISAGFDSRMEDPLGDFTLSDADFAELTEIVAGIARKHAGGRLISVLEGGYNLRGLAEAARAHVKALTEASGNGKDIE